jgi:hypothetical protein
VKYERIAILNALGAYYTFLATSGPADEKERNFVMATSYYNKASRIDAIEPSTWIGKGKSNLTVCFSCPELVCQLQIVPKISYMCSYGHTNNAFCVAGK